MVDITQRIRLGCARVSAGRQELHRFNSIVDTALELGIRHFDVAPSYGFGLAEELLGSCVQGVREARITTKFGLLPPPSSRRLAVLRSALKPVLGKLPASLKRKGASVLPRAEVAQFTPDQLRLSVEQSCQKLRRDRLDELLLHEPPSEIGEAFGAEAARLQRLGRIGSLGVGVGGSTGPVFGSVLQCAYSRAPKPSWPSAFCYHGIVRQSNLAAEQRPAIRSAAARVRETLKIDQSVCDVAALSLGILLSQEDASFIVSCSTPLRLRGLIDGARQTVHAVQCSPTTSTQPALVEFTDLIWPRPGMSAA